MQISFVYVKKSKLTVDIALLCSNLHNKESKGVIDYE